MKGFLESITDNLSLWQFPTYRFLQSLVEVSDEIVNVLDPDRDANQIVLQQSLIIRVIDIP